MTERPTTTDDCPRCGLSQADHPTPYMVSQGAADHQHPRDPEPETVTLVLPDELADLAHHLAKFELSAARNALEELRDRVGVNPSRPDHLARIHAAQRRVALAVSLRNAIENQSQEQDR